MRPGGAMVARLTPDQKVACSNHVRVRYFIQNSFLNLPVDHTISAFWH